MLRNSCAKPTEQFVHGFDRTLNLVATRREDMDDMEMEVQKSSA